MDTKLKALLETVEDAEESVIKRLEKLYPKGKDVRVYLHAKQFHPSGGAVIWYEGGCYGVVLVRLHRGKQSVKRVSARNII